MIRMGAHVKQDNPIAAAQELGSNLAQMFLWDPQAWKPAPLTYQGGAAQLKADAEAADIDLYVHAPYVINVATTNNRVRIPSRKLLQQTIAGAAEVGAKGVIVHGGHVLKDDDPAAGFENWRKCVAGLDLPVPIFIENTAGGTNAMARYLDRIEMLWEAISTTDNIDQVGFCLDTCHAFAGGLELIGLVDKIKAITGRIDLVHCNDSQGGFDSGLDRHANLGKGQVGAENLLAVILDATAPLVLETPGGTAEHRSDLEWLLANLQAGS